MIFCPLCSSLPVVITHADKRKNSQERRSLFWSQYQHIVHHDKEIKMPGSQSSWSRHNQEARRNEQKLLLDSLSPFLQFRIPDRE